MFMRITIVAIGVLMCTLATAQQLEDRVLELEHRVDQLEDKILQISSPSSTAKPPSSQSWRSLKREMTEKEVQSILLIRPLDVLTCCILDHWILEVGANPLW